MDSGNNSPPSVDAKRPAIQPEARFPQLSCAGDAIRSEKPLAVHHGRGFRFAQGVQRLLALGACPSSGGIFGTNLIPFEA